MPWKRVSVIGVITCCCLQLLAFLLSSSSLELSTHRPPPRGEFLAAMFHWEALLCGIFAIKYNKMKLKLYYWTMNVGLRTVD